MNHAPPRQESRMTSTRTITETLPHTLPEDADARLVLFAIRRLGAHGLHDACAAHAFVTAFGEAFRRPLVLMRAFMLDVASTRSEEHTSELQSLMRISYAVFCLKKKTFQTTTHYTSM